MINDMMEYYLIVTLVQWESLNFDQNLVEMVENCF